jgi:8-oxo-dGTP diphosphatase
VLSPVLPPGHPGAPHLSWENLRPSRRSIPVYALGGLTQDDMQIAWQHGAHGISLLRQAW